jgi:hypothetical protein
VTRESLVAPEGAGTAARVSVIGRIGDDDAGWEVTWGSVVARDDDGC